MALEKIEPKFNTKIIGVEIQNDARIKELIPWCLKFHNKNYAPPYDGGSYGNLSFRLNPGKNEFIITLSRSGLGDARGNNKFALVKNVDYDKREVYSVIPTNESVPSSEAMVHHALYKSRPEINAIFHGHCNEVSMYAEQIGIPITKEEKPYSTVALVEQVLAVPDNPLFLEMKNHGFIALGKTISEAGKLTDRICSKARNFKIK